MGKKYKKRSLNINYANSIKFQLKNNIDHTLSENSILGFTYCEVLTKLTRLLVVNHKILWAKRGNIS